MKKKNHFKCTVCGFSSFKISFEYVFCTRKERIISNELFVVLLILEEVFDLYFALFLKGL